jgi:hypothetical protein
MAVQGPDKTVGLPGRRGFGVGAGPAGNTGEIPPRPDPRWPVPAPRGIGEQVPIDRLPHLIGHVQPDRLGQVITHPTAGLDMRLRGSLDAFARQPQPAPQRFGIPGTLMVGRPIRATPIGGATLQRPAQLKHRRPLPLKPPADPLIGGIQLETDHRNRSAVFEIRGLRLAPPPRQHHRSSYGVVDVRGSHGRMQSQTTDNNALPHQYRNLLPLTGLTISQTAPFTPWPDTTGQRPRAALGTADCRQGASGAYPPAHQSDLAGGHQIPGGGGYRGNPSITTPRRDKSGRVDHHWRHHRRIRARVEHVIARLKD